MGSLLNSMSLVLEEFYRHLSVVGVSSMTGKGIGEFFDAVAQKAKEYERDYKPELERRQAERQKDKVTRRDKELGKLMSDMNVKPGSKSAKASSGLRNAKAAQREEASTLSDLEDEKDEDADAGDAESDDDEDEEEEEEADDDGAGEGLEGRYKKALQDESTPGRSADDHSFARYLNASNINR